MAQSSHRTVLLAVGAVLVALTAVDFAVDRVLDEQLLTEIAVVERHDPRLERLQRLRTAEQMCLLASLIGALALAMRWTRRTERYHVQWETSERARLDLRRMAGSMAHEVNG